MGSRVKKGIEVGKRGDRGERQRETEVFSRNTWREGGEGKGGQREKRGRESERERTTNPFYSKPDLPGCC